MFKKLKIVDSNLEQKIKNKSSKNAYDLLMSELNAIAEKYDLNLATSFELFSNAILTGRNYNLCFENIVGDGDGGIDSYYVNHDKKEIWLVQTKFDKVKDAFVYKMKQNFDNFIKGDMTPGNTENGLKKIKADYVKGYKPKFITTSMLGETSKINEINRKNIFSMLSDAGNNFTDINIELNLKLKAGDPIKKDFNNSSMSNDAYYIVTDLSSYQETLKTLNEYYYEYLFDMNLRGDVRNKSTVENIEKTISKKPGMFELYNNGVTIICDEINDNDDGLVLINPKIINGQQTTRTIKNYNRIIKSDARVMIKVIKNKNPDEINSIAQYSNSQSKIKTEDLLSCHKSIKTLKQIAAKSKVNIIIKSGDSKFLRFEKAIADQSIRLTEFIKCYYIINQKEKMGLIKSSIGSLTNIFIDDCDQIKWNNRTFMEVLHVNDKYNEFYDKIKSLNKRPIELNNLKRAQVLIMRSIVDGIDENKTIDGINKIIDKYRDKHGDEMNIFKSSSIYDYYKEFVSKSN